jgi:hypothetical protein
MMEVGKMLRDHHPTGGLLDDSCRERLTGASGLASRFVSI